MTDGCARQVPVLMPTMMDVITVSVWDHDHLSTDDAVGAMRFSFKELGSAMATSSGPPVLNFFPEWYNLYGAPPEVTRDTAEMSS